MVVGRLEGALIVPILKTSRQAKSHLEMQVGAMQWYAVTRGSVPHLPKWSGNPHERTAFDAGFDFCKVTVESVKGGFRGGMLKHQIFPVTAVVACVIDVSHNAIHGRKNDVLGSATTIALDGVKVEALVELVAVVSHATVRPGSYGVVGARPLQELGQIIAFAERGVGRRPGKGEFRRSG